MDQVRHFPPVLSLIFFAEHAGVSLRTVESWVHRGYVPTIKVGRHRLINVAALVAADQGAVPRHPAPQPSEERDGGAQRLGNPALNPDSFTKNPTMRNARGKNA